MSEAVNTQDSEGSPSVWGLPYPALDTIVSLLDNGAKA
jgi:hypothetical protein